ncbi:hypothetical protein E4T50_16499 [Aureobasidium sp. EXF-12298]|nr:hypothetical protein E4T50_16499 [Aureobasidium sp. EXF-12298]KAI4755403.1 hypothetical protein E4T51_11530 [Aureobasidium sp. EXF-12344]KAI4772353.1 hypothetical protein E4T52_12686 [Aureobasidium sp. EXF-3400]
MKFTARSDDQVPSRPESAFDRPYDSRYGVEVSITGGKPKKSTLVEKAAKFGRQAFGGRSASAGAKDDWRRPSLPIKDASGLYRDGSRVRASISTSSLVSAHSKTRNVRGSVSSSIYDEPETTDSIPPLNIVKKVPLPQLPPLCPTIDDSSLTGLPSNTYQQQSLEEHDDLARYSIDSNDSTKTVTQSRVDPSRSHFSWTTYAETERSVSPTSSYIANTNFTREPDSRFSWTTTNTDAIYQQDTPPCSPTPTYPTSIMSRRRPVPGRESVQPKRHDSMSDVQDVQQATFDKLLPQPPKTRQAMNHVEELTLQLESLEVQKTNMQKLFKDLEKVDSASPIEVSERMRRENRKKMSEVRIRQDEVQRELFEVGRLLSRARAKAEEADGSTGLWLRRVTD